MRRHHDCAWPCDCQARDGRPRPLLLIGYQLGRIISYSLAGLLFAGMLGGLIALLDIESVRRTLRALSALALLVAALVAFGRLRDPGCVSAAGSGTGSHRWDVACCRLRVCRAHLHSAWSGAGCPAVSFIRFC